MKKVIETILNLNEMIYFEYEIENDILNIQGYDYDVNYYNEDKFKNFLKAEINYRIINNLIKEDSKDRFSLDYEDKLYCVKCIFSLNEIHGVLNKIEETLESKEINNINKAKDLVIEIGQTYSEFSNTKKLLKNLLFNVRELVEIANCGTILLLDESNYFTVEASFGFDEEEMKGMRFKIEDSFYFLITQGLTHETIIINDLKKLIKLNNSKVVVTGEGKEVLSSMVAPIIINNKIYGTINIESDKNYIFREFHKKILDYIAKQIAIVLKQKFMYDEIKFLSIHDVMTGLGNRTAYEKLISELIDNKNEFFSIIIDINEFKKINDTYGHPEGDFVLIDFSNKLESTFGKNYAFRIGGDEFVVISLDANIESLNMKLESLNNICKLKGVISNQETINYSFSWGMAKFPEDGKTIEEIYKKSDIMLYENKKRLSRRSTD